MGEAARWLTAVETAEHLRMSLPTLRKKVREGKVPPPSYHLGEHMPRYDRMQIDALMSGHQDNRPVDQDAIAEGVVNGLAKGRTGHKRPKR